MKFAKTTCAACGDTCPDRLHVNRDGLALGPIVAVCEQCLPCGRPLQDVWADIEKRGGGRLRAARARGLGIR